MGLSSTMLLSVPFSGSSSPSSPASFDLSDCIGGGSAMLRLYLPSGQIKAFADRTPPDIVELNWPDAFGAATDFSRVDQNLKGSHPADAPRRVDDRLNTNLYGGTRL